ncbi:hypothetical protein [Halosegnis sp.]|uniref:hypothetical protein n=1 Tax=Halosegnis sp. TaxID=2864959 RepID=UPI0035D4EC2C
MSNDETDPFAELGDDEENAGDEDPFAELDEFGDAAPVSDDELFTEMDLEVEQLADADVDELLSGEADGVETPSVGLDATPERPADTEGVVVPKSQYCERCDYFSEPPTVACTHEGTAIHELVNTDHLLVTDCPVVAERGFVESTSLDE